MGVIGIILLVAFVIICVLLIAIVLLQNDEGGGLGGLLGGAGNAAFGSRSGNVLTRTTYILVALFFLASFGLALINKAPSVTNLDAAVQQVQNSDGTSEYWIDETVTDTSAPAVMQSADAAAE
ncbi:MAG TPA: preprotein translocase subunit SecG [Treponemataceae bacterium]|jgi:preprotein translocase subunit SecG|nr:preprotein translocase subunit SecG [Spirochaetaceae bacterium]HQL04951.1 preprotein translocase subunit SecG [Treponemataceae bacterium]